MAGEQKPRRLSEVAVAGRDYPAKVKIEEVLDHEVLLTDFDHVVIHDDVELEDGSKARVERANYYNVVVEDGEVIKTFSTGAQPITKILVILDKADLPLLATFRKQGQTYIVE